VRDAPYRTVEMREICEHPVNESDDEIRSAKLDLLASHGCLMRELSDDDSRGIVLDDRIPFETAVNGACANLPVDAAIRQGLLEEGDLRRRYRRVARLLDDVLARVLRLKALRTPEEGGTRRELDRCDRARRSFPSQRWRRRPPRS
jgi:hypothetical protein